MNRDKIIFNGYKIQEFSLKRNPEKIKIEKDTLKINKKIIVNNKNKNVYCLLMNLNIYTNDLFIEITIKGYFTINESIEVEVKKDFLNITAPTIIYPYIRALISNITSFDSADAVLLPVVNFANLD